MNQTALLTTFKRAKEVAALVAYATGVQIVYDPDSIPPDAWSNMAGNAFNPELGYIVVPVPKETGEDVTGAFRILGKINGADLAFPNDRSRSFLVDPTVSFLFDENVAELIDQKALLDLRRAAGHPLGNNNFLPGPNLVGTRSGDTKAVLWWASQPYTARYQVPTASAQL